MSLKKLYLELTDRCNLDCSICFRQSWQEPACDMSLDLYRVLLRDILLSPQIRTVVLGGVGEPTCSPILPACIEALSDRTLILTSNGMFDDDLVSVLTAHMDTIVISMDGLSERHRQVRGTMPDRIIANIQSLVKTRQDMGKGPQVLMQCVLTMDNLQDVLLLVDLAADLGADGLIFSHLLPQVLDNRDKTVYTTHENASLTALFNDMRIRSFRRGLRLTLPHLMLKTERFCSFIEEDASFVCASGKVVPCYRLSHDCTEYVYGRKKAVHAFSFGHLGKQRLMDIWNSHGYHTFRESVRNGRYPSCLDCDLVDGCDYVGSSDADCWCNTPSCGDCLWSRRLVLCP